jgi:hypothetical protein
MFRASLRGMVLFAIIIKASKLDGAPENGLKKARSFHIEIRDTPTATLNLTSLPSCVQKNCLDPTQTLSCPPVTTTCPEDAPTPTGKCITYPLDCFCALPTPLTCAFKPCSWFEWAKTEDLYAKLCPATKPIDFSPLPACARKCITDNSFLYGCITSTKACFCTHRSYFACEKKCKKASEVEEILNWFQTQCDTTPASASRALGDPEPDDPSEDSPKRPSAGSKLRWYEIMAVIVAVVTLVAIAIGMTLFWIIQYRAARKAKARKMQKND